VGGERWRSPAVRNWGFVGAAVALSVLLLWSRSALLSLSLWNDEAYSAYWFIDRGTEAILHTPYAPNNHVLFSLLASVTTRALGRGEIAYRLWSILPALLAVAVATVWAVRRLGRAEGLAVLFLFVTSPVHLDLAPQARGYGLGLLAAALMLASTSRAGDGRIDREGTAGLVIGGLIGICTLPVMVLPFVGQVGSLAIASGCWRPALIAMGVVGAGSVIFYRSLIVAILAASGQEFGRPILWHDVLAGPCRDVGCSTLELLSLDPKGPLALVVFLALAALGVLRLRRTRGWPLVSHVLTPIVSTYAGLVVLGLYGVPRFVSFLLPPICILVAAGVTEVVGRLSRHVLGPLAAFSTLALVAGVMLLRFVELTIAWSQTPVEGYREAVAVARASGVTPIVSNSYFRVGLQHYASGLAIEFPPAAEIGRRLCDVSAPFVYIHYQLYGEPVNLTCLAGRTTLATSIPQRAGGATGGMRVYVLAGDGRTRAHAGVTTKTPRPAGGGAASRRLQ
jgi:hypothetical protein